MSVDMKIFCDKCRYKDFYAGDEPCVGCILDNRDATAEPTEFKPVISDSGERTSFSSGAVRDLHQGKGRCDLLPMCVLLRLAKHYENGALKYQERNWERGIPAHSFADSALRHLFKYMDGKKDEDHLIAAIWNLCGLAWTEEKMPNFMDIPARRRVNDG